MSVEAFRAFSACSLAPQMLLAADGELLAVNRAAARLLGRPREELEGSRLQQWTDPAGASIDDFLERLSKTGFALPGMLSVVGADGEVVVCRTEGGRLAIGEVGASKPLISLRLVPKETSRSRFTLLTQQVDDLRREVARRRHAELLLAHQKKLLERIVGNLPLADVLLAIARFIEAHSKRSLCSILLLSDDGRRLVFGAAPSLPAAYNAAIDGVEIGPQVGSCGTAAFRAETVVVEDIASDPLWADYRELAAEHGLAACWSEPVKGPGGQVLATLAMYYREPGGPSPEDRYLTSIGVDLTAIAILNERSRATLRLRAEQLAEADRRKDRFLAMLSHELRNPLAPIVNTLEILSSQTGDPSIAEHVARLQRQTTHLSRLVDDLLDISRIAHGVVELKIDTLDLRDCLAQAVDSVRELIGSRRQTLSLPEDGEPMWVDGDASRLRQVFANLLTNAAKYTPPEGRIEVELGREDESVVVRVRDDGQGLAPEILEHLFEPFSQGATSALDAREGLGLGLTLVKQLVEYHGGTVEARSEGVDRGSELTVRLPAVDQGDEVPVPEDLLATEGVPALKVLVVEDNKDSADALAMLLELWGHDPRVCSDGDAAIEAAVAQDPDVILLDIDLPGRDGYGVLCTLRQNGFSTEDRLAIAMTGFGQLEDIEKSRAAGFHRHMTKPIHPADLRDALAEFSLAKAST